MRYATAFLIIAGTTLLAACHVEELDVQLDSAAVIEGDFLGRPTPFVAFEFSSAEDLGEPQNFVLVPKDGQPPKTAGSRLGVECRLTDRSWYKNYRDKSQRMARAEPPQDADGRYRYQAHVYPKLEVLGAPKDRERSLLAIPFDEMSCTVLARNDGDAATHRGKSWTVSKEELVRLKEAFDEIAEAQ